MTRIVLTLPWPISANRYWRTYMPKGFKAPVTAVSTEAKEYKRAVGLIARVAGIRAPIAGRVSVHLQLYPKRPKDAARRATKDPMGWDETVQCLDLDNARKVVYDALKGIVFEDDALIFRDSGERMEPDGEARVVVTIEPIVRVSPQPALFEGPAPLPVDRGPYAAPLPEKPF